MKLLPLAFAALCAGVESLRPKWHQLDGYSFEQYRRDFAKAYSSKSETQRRASIFEANLAAIQEHNSAGTATYKKGVNQFTDMTKEEVKAQSTGLDRDMYFAEHASRSVAQLTVTELQKQYPSTTNVTERDWRKEGVITPVKNQVRVTKCIKFSFVLFRVADHCCDRVTAVVVGRSHPLRRWKHTGPCTRACLKSSANNSFWIAPQTLTSVEELVGVTAEPQNWRTTN